IVFHAKLQIAEWVVRAQSLLADEHLGLSEAQKLRLRTALFAAAPVATSKKAKWFRENVLSCLTPVVKAPREILDDLLNKVLADRWSPLPMRTKRGDPEHLRQVLLL